MRTMAKEAQKKKRPHSGSTHAKKESSLGSTKAQKINGARHSKALPTVDQHTKLKRKKEIRQAKTEKKPKKDESNLPLDLTAIKKDIEAAISPGLIRNGHETDTSQGKHAHPKMNLKEHKTHCNKDWVFTGVEGFDRLLELGIPHGTATLVCGGPGSGKTIFCLQSLVHAVQCGQKSLYMTFEESPERLVKHMADFGWDAQKMIDDGKLVIKRYNPYDVTRQVEAMLEKAKGELLIDVQPLLFPEGFTPDRIVVDSLSAIAAAFIGKEETYRIYIEQLFKIFENIGATSFLISETSELPKKLTNSGVEEFLADGVIVIYNLRHGDVRESAIECLKLRGASFQKKIVAMQIKGGIGIEVYPEQEVFSDVG